MYLAQAVSLGLVLWLLTLAVNDANASLSFFDAVAIAALAWVVGFMTPGASAGIGIRETVLIFALGGLIGEPVAVFTALMLRVATLAGDALYFVASVAAFPGLGKSCAETPEMTPK